MSSAHAHTHTHKQASERAKETSCKEAAPGGGREMEGGCRKEGRGTEEGFQCQNQTRALYSRIPS